MAAPEIVNLLRAIADVIEKSDPEQVRAIADALSAGVKQARSIREPTKPTHPDLSNVAKRLIAANSRQDGHAILTEYKLTRNELSQLGREHSVHIVKGDNISDIEAKIVEALVGSRLSSKAIRGDK